MDRGQIFEAKLIPAISLRVFFIFAEKYHGPEGICENC